MPVAAALLAGLALTAQANTLSDLKPADRADLQCMAVAALAIAAAPDDRTRAGLTSGLTFYYGRLQGRTPAVDWLQRFADYARADAMADFEANRVRCATEMQSVGQAFIAVGAAMQKP